MTVSKVCLRDFIPEQDESLLREWLHCPHVSRWWGMQEIEDLVQRLPESRAVIVVDGIPAGYLCWQKPSQLELEEAGLTDLPAGLMDIDILIGEPDLLGQGIGPKALELLLKRLQTDPDVLYAGLATSVSNKRAKRAYEKAGFELFREFDDHESGPCYYLIREIDSDHI